MDYPLDTMRTLIRRFGSGLALVFMLNGIFASAFTAHAMDGKPDQGSAHHAVHGMAHPPEPKTCNDPPGHCHGNAPCCLVGQICSSSCIESIPWQFAANQGRDAASRPLDTAARVMRPSQPPLRPPRA